MKQVRWGLIGCGDIARKRVAPALTTVKNSILQAVSRAQSDKAQSFAQEFGVSRWYADWQQLVADPEIDAVYIATPVYLHAQQTVVAAKQGKHVLCEKPMALSTQECHTMIDACNRQHVLLGIAYYRHYYPAVLRIKEILSSGEIGSPLIAQINAFEYFNPPADHPRHWIIEKKYSGGGPMKDFGCHRIEVLLHLLGKAGRVVSQTTTAALIRQVEDTACITIEFESGALGTITVSHAVMESVDTLDIYCTRGSLHVPSLNRGELVIMTKEGNRQEHLPPHPNLHLPLIEGFVASLVEGMDFPVPGETGLEVERIEDIVYAKEYGLPNSGKMV